MRNKLTKITLLLVLIWALAACGDVDDRTDGVEDGNTTVGVNETPVVEEPAADTALSDDKVGDTEDMDAETAEMPADEPVTTEEQSDVAEMPADEAVTTDEQSETVMTEPEIDQDAEDVSPDLAQSDETPLDQEVIPPTGAINVNNLSILMDFEVWNHNQEHIGDIDDIVIDMDTSHIKYVVVGVGGFLGIGEKSVAIPWEAIEFNNTAMTDQTVENSGDIEGDVPLNAFLVNADSDRLDQAPAIDLELIHDRYEQIEANEEAVKDAQEDIAEGEAAEADDTDEMDALTFDQLEQEIRAFWQVEIDQANAAMTEVTTDDAANTEMTDAEAAADAVDDQMVAQTPAGDFPYYVLASDLLDATVISQSLPTEIDDMDNEAIPDESAMKDDSVDADVVVDTEANDQVINDTDVDAEISVDDEEVGEVVELVTDINSGQVKYVVVDLDQAFLDANNTEADVVAADAAHVDELTPIPLTAFDWNYEEEVLTLANTQLLRDAPTIPVDALQITDLSLQEASDVAEELKDYLDWEIDVDNYWGQHDIDVEMK